jgi:pSer/pThr/pTyr-binding forkhead associated (FHA) protein
MQVKMVVVQGRPAGKSLMFPHGEFYFGRGTECHVRPNSDWVSRQHCLLRVTSEGAFIKDLGSRNGTLVNGVLLARERRLQQGDLIQIGPLVFEVKLRRGLEDESSAKSFPPTPLQGPAGSGGNNTKGDSDSSDHGTRPYPSVPPEVG